MVLETTQQKQRAAEDEQYLSSVNNDFESLRAYVIEAIQNDGEAFTHTFTSLVLFLLLFIQVDRYGFILHLIVWQ